MKLKIDFIENEIILSKEYVTSIEIENKKMFYRLGELLNKYSQEEIAEEIFEEKIKLKLLIDFFNLDYNSKKTINNITKLVKDNIDEKKSATIKNNYKKILDLYEDILKEIDIPLIIDEEVNLDNLSKIFNLRIVYENNILKNLITLIDIIKSTHEYDLIVLINVKQYLTKEELEEFYKYAIYNEITVLLLDSTSYGPTINYEKKLLIDDNLEEYML